MNKKELEIVRDCINRVHNYGDDVEPIYDLYNTFRKLYYKQCHKLKDSSIMDWNPKYDKPSGIGTDA